MKPLVKTYITFFVMGAVAGTLARVCSLSALSLLFPISDWEALGNWVLSLPLAALFSGVLFAVALGAVHYFRVRGISPDILQALEPEVRIRSRYKINAQLAERVSVIALINQKIPKDRIMEGGCAVSAVTQSSLFVAGRHVTVQITGVSDQECEVEVNCNPEAGLNLIEWGQSRQFEKAIVGALRDAELVYMQSGQGAE